MTLRKSKSVGRALGEEGRTRVSICKIVKLHPEIKSRLLFHFEGGKYRELSYSLASSPLKNDMSSQARGACKTGPAPGDLTIR